MTLRELILACLKTNAPKRELGRGNMYAAGERGPPYNLRMLRCRTRLSLGIAIASTLIITTVAIATLCWP